MDNGEEISNDLADVDNDCDASDMEEDNSVWEASEEEKDDRDREEATTFADPASH